MSADYRQEERAEGAQSEANEEMHQCTLVALSHAWEGSRDYKGPLTLDELSLLCWHAGVTLKEIIDAHPDR